MKIYLWLLSAALLQAIKIPFCGIMGITFGLSTGTYYVSEFIGRLQRIIHIQVYRMIKKRKVSKVLPKPIKLNRVVKETHPVVGKTRTEFIRELPKPEPAKPYISEPIEKETVTDAYEEPDIDPNDIDAEDYKIIDILAEEDPEMFSDNSDLPSELSMGVTIEELTTTYETLVNKDSTTIQDDKAVETLSKIAGTVLADFFLLQKEASRKAKMLLEKETDRDFTTDNMEFDINTYI